MFQWTDKFQAQQDWVTISPNAKGDISYAYFLQFVINYACEKCEAFKEGLSK